MILEKWLEYLIDGTVLILALIISVLVLAPTSIVDAIVSAVLFAKDSIQSFLNRKHEPTQQDLDMMAKRIEWENRLSAELRDMDFAKRKEEFEQQKRIDTENQLAKEKTKIRTIEIPQEPEPEFKFLNIYERFFFVKDLTPNQIKICKNEGYIEMDTNPYGPGKGPKVLIKPPDNQSAIHYYFCRILKLEIERYGHTARIYESVRPDVVSNRIAFEVETGSHYRKKDLDEKFRRAKENYSDYYILVTKRELRKKYEHYGKVITRNDIKKTVGGIYNSAKISE